MLAMADSRGRVWGSIPGLANRARVSVEDCRSAIKFFMEPDSDSRTKEHEGRRIEEIDGGWRLLNHGKYRAIRDEESIKESKRKYINTRRAIERNVENVDRSRDIAEAYTEAEAKIKTKPSAPSALDVRFQAFWKAYPRKVGKGAAERLWKRLAPDAALLAAILAAIESQLTCEQWTKDGGQFIPHPSTWLSRKGWLDEVPEPIDYGRCTYCADPATAEKNGIAHCGRHIDFAKQGAR